MGSERDTRPVPVRAEGPRPSGQARIDHSVTLTVLDAIADAIARNARAVEELGGTLDSILAELRAKRVSDQRRAGHVPTDEFGDPLCPKCGGEMVIRTMKDGGKFWGCVKWSTSGCKGTRPFDFDPVTAPSEPKAPATPAEVVDV